MAISYFDAPAGAGKTHVLVEHAHRKASQGQKILFVQPSRELISRTINCVSACKFDPVRLGIGVQN